MTLTAAEFAALATAGVPYVGQLGRCVERFEPGANADPVVGTNWPARGTCR